MAVPYLIIDGYNLMHAAGLARTTYGPGGLEQCRRQLIASLKTLLSSDVQKHATVVFDAFQSVTDDGRHQVSGDLSIVFAPRGTDADSEIESMLQQHSVPKRVIVVSSDHRLHRAASRRKAKCVDSEVFWQSIECDSPVSVVAQTGRAAFDEKELGHWLREFADVRPADDNDGSGHSFDAGYVQKIQDDLKRGKLP